MYYSFKVNIIFTLFNCCSISYMNADRPDPKLTIVFLYLFVLLLIVHSFVIHFSLTVYVFTFYSPVLVVVLSNIEIRN